MGCKGDPPGADDGGCGGVPHIKVPPSPGEEKGGQVVDSTRRGDEVGQFVDLVPDRLRSVLYGGVRFRMATKQVQFTGVD